MVGDAGLNFIPLRLSLGLNAYVIRRQIWLDEKPPLLRPVPPHLYIVSENGVFCTIFPGLGGFLISFKSHSALRPKWTGQVEAQRVQPSDD